MSNTRVEAEPTLANNRNSFADSIICHSHHHNTAAVLFKCTHTLHFSCFKQHLWLQQIKWLCSSGCLDRRWRRCLILCFTAWPCCSADSQTYIPYTHTRARAPSSLNSLSRHFASRSDHVTAMLCAHWIKNKPQQVFHCFSATWGPLGVPSQETRFCAEVVFRAIWICLLWLWIGKKVTFRVEFRMLKLPSWMLGLIAPPRDYLEQAEGKLWLRGQIWDVEAFFFFLAR